MARSRLYVVISSLPRGVNCYRTRNLLNSYCKTPSDRITTLLRHFQEGGGTCRRGGPEPGGFGAMSAVPCSLLKARPHEVTGQPA